MGAPDEWLYEYAVVRFMPHIEREEFLNIGLLMLCKRRKWLKGMVVIDEEKIKTLFPKADLESLKNQSRLFEMTNVPAPDLPAEEKYRWLTAVKSASLRVSPSHPGIAQQSDSSSDSDWQKVLDLEFERLFNNLVL